MSSSVSSFADVLMSIGSHLKKISSQHEDLDDSIESYAPRASTHDFNKLLNMGNNPDPLQYVDENKEKDDNIKSVLSYTNSDSVIVNSSLKNYATKLYDQLTDEALDATSRDLTILRRACQECAKYVHKTYNLKIEDEDAYLEHMQLNLEPFIKKENQIAQQHDKNNEEAQRLNNKTTV